MGTATTGSIEYHCSFCGKEQKQVERLIASLGGVYICDNCVELCTEIIQEGREAREAQRTVPPAEPHA